MELCISAREIGKKGDNFRGRKGEFVWIDIKIRLW